MRKLIGSAVLAALLLTTPALAVAQRRRPAARPAPARSERPSFGVELDVGTDTDFGLGARAVFGLQSLFPKTPLDGQVGFIYFFPSASTGVDAKYWEINGNVAYRVPTRARSSLKPYVGGGLNIAHHSATAGHDRVRHEGGVEPARRHDLQSEGSGRPVPRSARHHRRRQAGHFRGWRPVLT